MEPKRPGEEPRSAPSAQPRPAHPSRPSAGSAGSTGAGPGARAAHSPPRQGFSRGCRHHKLGEGPESDLSGGGKELTYAGSSRGWPRASRWRGWLPCSCLWAGGSLRRASGSPCGHRLPPGGSAHSGGAPADPELPGGRRPGFVYLAGAGLRSARSAFAARGGAAPTGPNRPRGRNKGALCAGPPAGGCRNRPTPAQPDHPPRPAPLLAAARSPATPARVPARPSGRRRSVRPAARRAEGRPRRPLGPARPHHAPPRPSPRRRPLARLGARSRVAGTGTLGHGAHLQRRRERPTHDRDAPAAHARTRPLISRRRAGPAPTRPGPPPAREAPPRPGPPPAGRS